MKKNNVLLLIVIALGIQLFILTLIKNPKQDLIVTIPNEIKYTPLPIDNSPKIPIAKISTLNPGHLNYKNLNLQLRKWEEEARDLMDIGTYGNSSEGQILTFVKLTNELNNIPKSKILIMSCIHGNEENATDLSNVYLSSLLNEYNKNEKIKKLLDDNEIYFIPVVSPDSYERSQRELEGIDPNRDFINKKLSIIRYLQQFHVDKKFNKVMSIHSHGRMLLIPFGYKNELCQDHKAHLELAQKMSRTSGYRVLRACELYGVPIQGGELDYFYLNGAKISMVQEISNHQGPFDKNEIENEFRKTWESFILFLEN